MPTVGDRITTGNSIPVAEAGANFTIPAGTPFALTAGASDADAGDSLTYSWEQRDLGPQASVNAGDTGQGPLFRAWPPAAEPTRTFPRLDDLRNNTTSVGETLPEVARDLNFRVTVRDNRAGGGGVATDDMVVSVVDTGSPFRVLSPNTSTPLSGNSVQNVQWDVAGTDANGIDADFVNIRLSIDGGLTYPIILAERTPNDGAEEIVVPDTRTTQGRVRVEASENVFFDISDQDFAITAPLPGIVANALDGLVSAVEDGPADQYAISLNTQPVGPVVVTVDAPDAIEISSDGVGFSDSLELSFSNSLPQTVFVRAVDNQMEEGLRSATISHDIVSTADPVNYPASLEINDITVEVIDNDLSLDRVEPLGSLVTTAAAGSFVRAGESREFDLFLTAGSTAAATVTPQSYESLTVELVGVSSTFTSAAPGEAAVLPLTPTVESRLHTLRISATGATSFDIEFWGNTAFEGQVGDTSDGSELDITNSLVSLGSGRFAVRGRFDSVQAGIAEFTQTNNPALFVDISTTGIPLGLGDEGQATLPTTVGNDLLDAGNVGVSNNGVLFSPASAGVPFGNGSLPSGAFQTALVPFWDDLAATSGNVFWEERQINGINTLIVQWNDRPHFDVGGRATIQVQLYETGTPLARYLYPDVVFGGGAVDFGASATVGYQRSTTAANQFSRNTGALTNGDVLELTLPPALDADEYLLDLTGRAGERIDVILSGLNGLDVSEQTLELLGPDGSTVLVTGNNTPLSPGTPATNYDLAILGFTVPEDGIYTLRATSSVTGDYTLLVTNATSFDTEPNDLAEQPLRELSREATAVGYLGASDTRDIYEVQLNAGDPLLLTTDTPIVGSPDLNTLDPELEIRGPGGSIIASDTDGALDGRNATTIVSAPVTGAYQIHVAATAGDGEYLLTLMDEVPLPTVTLSIDTSRSLSPMELQRCRQRCQAEFAACDGDVGSERHGNVWNRLLGGDPGTGDSTGTNGGGDRD